MISLPQEPRVLLLSGGPGSSYLLALGGWQRVYTVKSVSYALRDKLLPGGHTAAERVLEYLGIEHNVVTLNTMGFRSRDFGLKLALYQIREREGSVPAYTGHTQLPDTAVRRPREDNPDGIPEDRFRLSVPDELGTLVQPLAAMTLAQLYSEYRARGWLGLWNQTHSCFMGQACGICESCRLRSWAQTG